MIQVTNSWANLRSKAKIGHVYGAVGNVWAPGTFRIGGKSYELGILAPGVIGVNGLKTVKAPIFMSYGVGYDGETLGLLGGVGFEFWHWWIIEFRFEGVGFVSFKNNSGGHLFAGINVGI